MDKEAFSAATAEEATALADGLMAAMGATKTLVAVTAALDLLARLLPMALSPGADPVECFEKVVVPNLLARLSDPELRREPQVESAPLQAVSLLSDPEDDPRVAALFAKLQMLLAGERVDIGWAAISDQFAALIGFAAEDEAQVEKLVEDAASDLRETIKQNWPQIRAARQRAQTGSESVQ